MDLAGGPGQRLPPGAADLGGRGVVAGEEAADVLDQPPDRAVARERIALPVAPVVPGDRVLVLVPHG